MKLIIKTKRRNQRLVMGSIHLTKEPRFQALANVTNGQNHSDHGYRLLGNKTQELSARTHLPRILTLP